MPAVSREQLRAFIAAIGERAADLPAGTFAAYRQLSVTAAAHAGPGAAVELDADSARHAHRFLAMAATLGELPADAHAAWESVGAQLAPLDAAPSPTLASAAAPAAPLEADGTALTVPTAHADALLGSLGAHAGELDGFGFAAYHDLMRAYARAASEETVRLTAETARAVVAIAAPLQVTGVAAGALTGIEQQLASATGADPGEEGELALPHGRALRFDATPGVCRHVRIIDADGSELRRWASEDWRDAPASVMADVLRYATGRDLPVTA